MGLNESLQQINSMKILYDCTHSPRWIITPLTLDFTALNNASLYKNNVSERVGVCRDLIPNQG